MNLLILFYFTSKHTICQANNNHSFYLTFLKNMNFLTSHIFYNYWHSFILIYPEKNDMMYWHTFIEMKY